MSTKNFEKSKDRLREIQVRLWTLQYFLLQEAANQNQVMFPDKDNDLADYLCTVHFALGQRLYCKHSNRQFVKLVRTELNSLETTNDYTADMAQVLYDLYQMKFVVGQGDFDHGCPTETLDKKTALSLIPTVMFYAKRLHIKDLIKSDLRVTIEKVQAASGKTVSPSPAMHNRK
ncbi:MAG: Histone transcription regulator 3, partial [Watsoniomyces obsoletus]